MEAQEFAALGQMESSKIDAPGQKESLWINHTQHIEHEEIKMNIRALLKRALLEKLTFSDRLDFQMSVTVRVDGVDTFHMANEETTVKHNAATELHKLKLSELYDLCLNTDVYTFRDAGLQLLKPMSHCESQTELGSLEPLPYDGESQTKRTLDSLSNFTQNQNNSKETDLIKTVETKTNLLELEQLVQCNTEKDDIEIYPVQDVEKEVKEIVYSMIDSVVNNDVEYSSHHSMFSQLTGDQERITNLNNKHQNVTTKPLEQTFDHSIDSINIDTTKRTDTIPQISVNKDGVNVAVQTEPPVKESKRKTKKSKLLLVVKSVHKSRTVKALIYNHLCTPIKAGQMDVSYV